MKQIPILSDFQHKESDVWTLRLQNHEKIDIKIVPSKSGYPKQIQELISKEKTSVYPILLVPFISEQTAELCKESGVGYLDMSGNCYISSCPLFIEIKGNKNPRPEKRGLKSIYERSSVVSSLILRTLLMDIHKTWRQQELADTVSCSLGQVAKVKAFLVNRQYAEQRKKGFFLTNPQSLLRDWAGIYNQADEERIPCYSLDGIPRIEQKIARMKQDIGVRCLLTGFSGGVRYQPVVRYQKIHALIDYENLDAAVDYLKLKKVDSGANVVLIPKYDDCVGYDGRMRNGCEVASPVQVYLDCMGLKGRGEEMAEAILNREICK